jgi:hypothetical protein
MTGISSLAPIARQASCILREQVCLNLIGLKNAAFEFVSTGHRGEYGVLHLRHLGRFRNK